MFQVNAVNKPEEEKIIPDVMVGGQEESDEGFRTHFNSGDQSWSIGAPRSGSAVNTRYMEKH